MSSIFPDIDPDITSGTDLANLLNDFKDCVVSGFKSTTTRPANLQIGGNWIDDVSDPVWDFKIYDGTTDHTVFSVNRSTGQVTLGSFGDSLKLTKDSDDSLPAKLTLFKKRTTGDQVQDQDVIGQVDFSGNSDTPTEQIVAQMEVKAEEAFTDAEHGVSWKFLSTIIDTSALVEIMRIDKNGRIGINTLAEALSLLHVKGNSTRTGIRNEHAADTAVGPKLIMKKARVAGSGQVLNDDVVGDIDFVSVDGGGLERTVARIQCKTLEDTTAAEHGAELIFSTVAEDGNTLQEILTIKNGSISGDNFQDKLTLQDDQATRQLFQIDSATYNSFELQIEAQGRDTGSDERFQVVTYRGVYDPNNTTWVISKSLDETLSDGNELLTFAIVNGTTLTINYVNQIPFGVFQDGNIYRTVRRNK